MNGSSTHAKPFCHKHIRSQTTKFWKGGSNKTTIFTPSVGSRSSTGVVERSQLLWFVCLLRACQTKRSKHSYGFFLRSRYSSNIRLCIYITSLNSFLVGQCKSIKDSLYTKKKIHHNIFTVIKKDMSVYFVVC